jgi:hypothetical protein
MRLTVLTDDRAIGEALLTADSSAEVQDLRHIGTLNADLSASSAIAFTLKSLATVPALAKSLFAAIASVTVPKPKAKLVLKGPFGQITLDIANVTEDGLRTALENVFDIFDRKTPAKEHDSKGTGKSEVEKTSSERRKEK